ncbi:hypothetical protein ACN4EE_01310 [Geminocystis sp. CENA526]|uniref:hypothetical protein n=1 Tax=Geminocystis sp. CENA526 TaxID=1355871 RepID=UPI003D6EC21C
MIISRFFIILNPQVKNPPNTPIPQYPDEIEYPHNCPFSIEQILDNDFYGM